MSRFLVGFVLVVDPFRWRGLCREDRAGSQEFACFSLSRRLPRPHEFDHWLVPNRVAPLNWPLTAALTNSRIRLLLTNRRPRAHIKLSIRRSSGSR
jgi:hypothetical protein